MKNKKFWERENIPSMPEGHENMAVALQHSDIENLALLPCQVERHFELTPEQLLCSQLLFDTLEELKKTFQPDSLLIAGRGRASEASKLKTREEILSWISGDRAKLSFVQICDSLDLCPNQTKDWIIHALRGWITSSGERPLIPARNVTNRSEGLKPNPIFTRRFDRTVEFQRRRASQVRIRQFEGLRISPEGFIIR